VSPAPAAAASRLYAIADGGLLGGVERLPNAVEAMARAGAGAVQWRVKESDLSPVDDADQWRALLETTERLRLLRPAFATLWINDRVDLAKACGAFGVHLGQDDLPPDAAREILGTQALIGRSTHDLPQVEAAAADPNVDWIAVGPVFATTSKADAQPVVGLDLLRHARRFTQKPLVAIGGIGRRNARAVLDAGADWVAVLSAVCVGDVERNVAGLLEAIA
jgi:thiamine-phosphate pyrophosphorylase